MSRKRVGWRCPEGPESQNLLSPKMPAQDRNRTLAPQGKTTRGRQPLRGDSQPKSHPTARAGLLGHQLRPHKLEPDTQPQPSSSEGQDQRACWSGLRPCPYPFTPAASWAESTASRWYDRVGEGAVGDANECERRTRDRFWEIRPRAAIAAHQARADVLMIAKRPRLDAHTVLAFKTTA
jgi:hypothetical protein